MHLVGSRANLIIAAQQHTPGESGQRLTSSLHGVQGLLQACACTEGGSVGGESPADAKRKPHLGAPQAQKLSPEAVQWPRTGKHTLLLLLTGFVSTAGNAQRCPEQCLEVFEGRGGHLVAWDCHCPVVPENLEQLMN